MGSVTANSPRREARKEPRRSRDLQVAWDRHVRFGLADPALFALVTDPARAARSPAAAAGIDVLRTRVHRIAATGRLRVPERRAIDLIHAAGTGAVLTLLATPEQDRDPTLADTLYDAVLRTVLTDAPTDHHRSHGVRRRRPARRRPRDVRAHRRRTTLLTEWLDRIAAS